MKVSAIVPVAGLSLLIAGCATSTKIQQPLCDGDEQSTSRVLLQQLTASSAIIKWRGEADAVCIGKNQQQLGIHAEATDEGLHKIAHLTGLDADTEYFYSIGAAATAPADQTFRTAPTAGTVPGDGNLHIWILGDSGTAGEADSDGGSAHPGEAIAVREGFFKYNATKGNNESLDLLLLLGDNAYPVGSDVDWQRAFFAIYPGVLKRTLVVPTIGNHEMGLGPFDMCTFQPVEGCDKGPVNTMIGGASTATDPANYDSDGDGPDAGGLPYLDIFSLPTAAELGGIPSGTEQYYSINYGNLHIVSLDSQLSNFDPVQRQAMRDWLIDDLSANSLDWTIVIFHHPPYSKGQHHDSDLEQREIDMRETFASVFERYGVDIVYGGHAHSYERSWYLGGHHRDSNSFDQKKHAETDSAGRATFGQQSDFYPQVSKVSGADDKVVYTVAGSSGKAGYDEPCREGRIVGCTQPDWLMHPAHRSFEPLATDYRPNGIARLGSVVLDVTEKTLTSRFVDHQGEVLDYFIIKK